MNVFRYLTDDGLIATDNYDMATTADKYYVGPDDGKYWELTRIIVYMEDDGTTAVSGYGSAAALTNGCKLYTTRGGVDGAETLDLTGGVNIKTNGNWDGLCYDMKIEEGHGAGNDIVLVRYTFAKSGRPPILRGSGDEKLVFQTQDSLATLVHHTIMLQGREVSSLD